MPQMSPYNWLTLNILFTLIFLIFIIMIHFTPISLKLTFSPLSMKSPQKFLIKW